MVVILFVFASARNIRLFTKPAQRIDGETGGIVEFCGGSWAADCAEPFVAGSSEDYWREGTGTIDRGFSASVDFDDCAKARINAVGIDATRIITRATRPERASVMRNPRSVYESIQNAATLIAFKRST
jgi:hypothetical protein